MKTNSAADTVSLASAEQREVQKIVVCHLESLTCLPALNRLFSEFGNEIEAVVISQRFGAGHGGFFSQLWENLRRSGVRMTFWLGFDLIAAEVVGAIARAIPFADARRLHSLPALARKYGATVIRTADINSPTTVQQLKEIGPDLLLVMNFDQILHPAAISVARVGVLNIHPSLLPDLRGPCPVFWALAEGRVQSGTTLHLIDDSQIDAGPIVAQLEVGIAPHYSVAEINARLFLNGVAMLGTTLSIVAQGAVMATTNTRPGSYRSFPRRAEVVAARQSGVRLCSISFAASVIAQALGLDFRRANKRGGIHQ